MSTEEQSSELLHMKHISPSAFPPFPRELTNFCDINPKMIGISLDTACSNCGFYINDKIELIQFQNGESSLPNFVCFNQDNKDVLVGEQAKKKVFSDFRFYDSIEMLGLKYEEVLSLSKYKKYPFKIVNDNGIPKFETKYNKETVYITAIDITCEILKFIKKMSDNKLENDSNKITEAIVTIPTYFNELKRNLIKRSAEIVGIKIIDFIDDLKSAVISKCYITNSNNNNIPKDDQIEMILKFNESSFCCYLVKINYNEKEYEVLKEIIVMEINGYEITKRIENYILNIYEKETENSRNNIEVKKLLQLSKISNEARQLLGMGIENEYEFSWSVLMNEGIECSLTIDDYNEICNDIYERIAVELDKISLNNRINEIIEIGEMCRYKRFEEMIEKKFPSVDIFKDINQEDICCCGSVVLGNIKGYNFKTN